MTFVLKLDLGIVMTYQHPNMESIGQTVQKVLFENRDRHTDRQTMRQTCVKPLPTLSQCTNTS